LNLLMILACGSMHSGEPAEEAAPAPEAPAPAAAAAEAPAAPDAPAEEAVAPADFGDPYAVVGELRLDGPALIIPVRYGGGCEEHGWSLVAGPRADDSAVLRLVHDGNNDRCKAMKFQEARVEFGDLDLCGVSSITLEVSSRMGDDQGPLSARLPADLAACE
jgi:hypothetical protein